MNELLKRAILGYRHNCYDATVDIAKFANQIVTGKDYAELVVNYKPRESSEQKKQRVRISQVRTKAPAGKIEGFFKRVFRADKLKFDIDHESNEEKAKISQYIDKYGDDGESLLLWSEETALYYNNVDPNAFYWVKHSVVDDEDMFEPFIFNSEEVLDYKIKKGGVKYCVTKLIETVHYLEDDLKKEKDICIYYYFDADVIQTVIEFNKDIANNSDYYDIFRDMEVETELLDNKEFIVLTEVNEIGVTPVSRIGYKYDYKNQKNSYVTFWDDASEIYKILVQDGSALDIALRLHTFPKLISYYTPCNYQDVASSQICKSGKLHPTGHDCPSCGGTGKKVHTGGQDVIEIQLPTADDPFQIKPSDLMHYVDMPFDIVEKLDSLVKEATPQIAEAIFGVDISHQQGTNATATQVKNYYDTAQDALYEFTKSPRKIFLFTIDIMSKYLGIENLTRELLYTNEYNLESESELLEKLKMAKEAGASPEVVENINKRLVNKQNRTDSTYMNVYNAMRKFEPFRNVPPDIKAMLIAERSDSDLQKSLYLNLAEITEHILANNEGFLLLDYESQKQVVEELAKGYADMAVEANSVRNVNVFREEQINNLEE